MSAAASGMAHVHSAPHDHGLPRPKPPRKKPTVYWLIPVVAGVALLIGAFLLFGLVVVVVNT